MKKKFLSSVLVLCMMLTLLPTTVFAVGETAKYAADTGVLTIEGAGLPTSGTFDLTKVTVGDDTKLTGASSCTLNSATAITITVAGADKTAVDKLFAANGEATVAVALAADYGGSGVGSAINVTKITVSGIPGIPTAAIDYAAETVTGAATTMEYVIDTTETASATTVWTDAATCTGTTIALAAADFGKHLHIRTKAAGIVPAGIVLDLAIKARPATPADASAVTLSATGAAVGKTKVTLAVESEFKITKAGTASTVTGTDMKQDWTVGAPAGAETTNTVALVAGDLVWVRTAATQAAFASLGSTTSKAIETADIGKAEDKSAATVALGTTGVTAGAVVAGTSFELKITDAKGTDGSTALTGAKKVTVTSSVTTDGTSGKVFDADVTFTTGAATVTIPAEALKKAATDTTLTVAIAGVKTVTGSPITVIVKAAAAAKLVVKTQPTAPTANGAVLAIQPAVEIQDKYGNIVTTDSTTEVTAAVTTSQTWTLGGTATATASSGVATFADLTAASAAEDTTATITFTSGVLTAVTSAPAFTIPAPAADASTATVALGTTGVTAGAVVAGATFDLAITGAKDTNGSTDLTGEKNVTVTSSVSTDGTSGKVFDADVTFATGAATVPIPVEVLKKAATDTTLTVTIVGVKTVTGSPITVIVKAAAAAKLVVKTQPTAPTANGAVLAIQPAVEIQDKYGNIVTTDSTTEVTAAVTTSQTWTLGGTATATASSGVATFADLTAASAAEDTTATITFTIAAPALTATSSAFTIPAPPVADIATLSPIVNATTGVISGDTATAGSGTALTYYLVSQTKATEIVKWNVDTLLTDAATALGTTAFTKRTLTFADNSKYLVVIEATAAGKVVAAGQSSAINVASGYAITNLGTEATGGAGLKRTITCTAETDFTNVFLVVQITEGSGETAKVSVVMVPAAASVEISYKTTATIHTWLTNKMPTLTGNTADGTTATIYASNPQQA